MVDPNLIVKTVKGREVRECRTCANKRFKQMRKDKKDRNKTVDKDAGKALNGSQPIAKLDPLEEIVKELNEQQGPDVDPMEFLEESGPVAKPALDAVAENEEIAAKYGIDLNNLPAVPEFATGGIIPEGPPVIVGEAVFDCHVERMPDSLREQASLEIGGTVTPDGTLNVTEVSLVETLHTPHGTPVVPPPPKVRYGCDHGFSNRMLCPQCRANRRP
jgi:hypothetical protein